PRAATQPVFMAHGALDPVIPQAAGLYSATILRQLGFAVDWHSYPMEHAVSQDEIRDIGDWLSRRFSGG
ncbi:MAG: carboxylesterase, partial [Xanthomonadaceae bacterium]|nr:carboxylesterase [Xanthomonadaceae bacterium]